MKKGFLATVLALLACAGTALAGQEPDPGLNLWVDGGAAYWWLQNQPVHLPLVTGTTEPPLVNPLLNGAGIFGKPRTTLLAGNGDIDQQANFGGQAAVGFWFDHEQCFGFEARALFLADNTVSVALGSDSLGAPLLARPVIDARTNSETVLYVAAPTLFKGAISVDATSRLYGAEGNAIFVGTKSECSYFNVMAGFRYLGLREELDVNSTTEPLAGGVAFFESVPVVAGNRITVFDDFQTRNDFYGGQIGIQGGYCWGPFVVSANAKVAIGNVRQEVTIAGFTRLTTPAGQTLTAPGGLLAQPTNGGTFVQNTFAVLPAANLTVTLALTSRMRLLAGYDILYLSEVVRPGDQIDRSVNRTMVPTSQTFNPALGGPAHPGFTLTTNDFWANGFTVGLSLSF
jgi:hypothetical protein